MHPVDLAVIVVYILGCTILGAYLGTTAKGLKGYFLGESNIPAWAVMISIVATETSTASFLSVPGVAYKGDFTYLQLALGYILGRIVISLVLMPSYFKGEIYTVYQLLHDRFGGATKTTASLLFLATRTLGDGLRLFLAAKVLQQLFLVARGPAGEAAWVMPASILIVGLATIVYTYLGGMKAVVWTDVIQFVVYIIGALAALAIIVGELPNGWSGLVSDAQAAGKLRFFNFAFDLSQPYTFWAGVLGGMVLNTATHGADQLMVQRYLSARSEGQARAALITSGFVVFLQFALFLTIGVALWSFYQTHPPVLPGGRAISADEELPYFIVRYLPTGLLGLVVAAIFAAAMSTLSGSLNASASSTVNDLYRPLFPETSEDRLLGLSRRLTIFWGFAQMAVAFAATRLQDNVVNNALAIASFVTGILLGVFLLGLLTTRVNQRAALIGLVAGVLADCYIVFAPKLPAPFDVIYPFDKALAWPWYALVGSSTVFLVGLLASGPAAPTSAIGKKPPAQQDLS